jgi:hypothetical protein
MIIYYCDLSAGVKNTFLYLKKFLSHIDFNGIKNVGTFSVTPSIINENLKKVVAVYIYYCCIGLHQPLDGVTNPKYKLQCFLTTNFFLQREEGTSF